VESVGGVNKFSPLAGTNAGQLMKSLQQLIKENPEYLTSGIPTHLIQQMMLNKNNDQSVMQTKVMNNRAPIVCYNFIIFSYRYFDFTLKTNL
jgi:hypothetical protein